MKAKAISTVKQARDAMRWVAPTKRPMCSNCRRAREELKGTGSLYESVAWHCALGDFPTLKQAVCANWEPAK